MSTKFVEMCEARRAAGKHVCVGLDPDIAQIPDCVPGGTDAQRVYNYLVAIVDTTHEFAMCYKPQSSYYEALGDDGMEALRRVVEYIRSIDPTIPVILDFKRGDIGRTNEKYVELAFSFYGADAATIHPYLGMEAMRPFLDWADKTLFVLCRTSNNGAAEFQDVLCRPLKDAATGRLYASPDEADREGAIGDLQYVMEGMPFYEFVAWRVAQSWNAANGNCGLVVGATYPIELKHIRAIVGDLPILIPGVGAQGGDLTTAVEYGSANGALGVINNSSAVLFAYKKIQGEGGFLKYRPSQWAEAAAEAARTMNDDIVAILVTV